MKRRVLSGVIVVLLSVFMITSITGCETQTEGSSQEPVEVAVEKESGDETSESVVSLENEEDGDGLELTGEEEFTAEPESAAESELTQEPESEPVSESVSDSGSESSLSLSTHSVDTDDELSDTQRNSLAMLNYLAVVTEEINSSKNSRMSLEAVYSSLINNTNPSAIDDRTTGQIEGLLDTIEDYRMIDVKRDRLEYIYEQNQAQALRDAMPNPLGLLSAVQSGDLIRLATSVVYMAVDSATSYQTSSANASLQYLTAGWELDDEEARVLHERRKDTFTYMVRIVNDYDIPGNLALREEAVDQLVSWEHESNVARRIQFLESEQETYEGYAGYWLILARSYFEAGELQNCLSAFYRYEDVAADIFYKDTDYARSIPIAIGAASEVMGDDEYVAFASKYVEVLRSNCKSTDWELRYFAAQTYIDLYARTGETSYLENAYELAKSNVNYLIDEQKSMNEAYLSPVVEVKAPAGSTKAKEDEYKQYNKMLKEERKTALPSVSQPLVLNCELLFAIADELDIDETERTRVDAILHPGGEPLFLTQPIDARYRFSSTNGGADIDDSDITFTGNTISVPASLVSESTVVTVTVGARRIELDGEWKVKSVKRGTEGDLTTFTVVYENKDASWPYSDGTKVTVTFADGEGEGTIVRSYDFVAEIEERPIIPDKVSFERA